MCTALNLKTQDHYFGRNLDLDRSYGEEVTVMPRRFSIGFRKMGEINKHFAIIGMATVAEESDDQSYRDQGGLPLFYDGVNEHGLSAAGLNFPGNACYLPPVQGKDNIASFEFIPWILCQCVNVKEAVYFLERINILNISFSKDLPPAPLHWIISDRDRSVVVEQMYDGLHIHENPIGILTNNPPFKYQIENLKKYSYLRNDNAEAVKEDNPAYTSYSQGLGAVGMPGDVSSMSRFVRIAFGKENSVCDDDELSSVGQFFHLLASVEMVKGSCKTDEGRWDTTRYSSCINTDRGLYYYTTYGNRRITCVDMHKTDLDIESISRYPLIGNKSIMFQN